MEENGDSNDPLGVGIGSAGIGTGTGGLGTDDGITEPGLGGAGSDITAHPGTGGLGHPNPDDLPTAGPGVGDAGVGTGAGVGLGPSAGFGGKSVRREINDEGVGQVAGTAQPDDAPSEGGAGQGPGSGKPPQPEGPGGSSELGGPTET